MLILLGIPSLKWAYNPSDTDPEWSITFTTTTLFAVHHTIIVKVSKGARR